MDTIIAILSQHPTWKINIYSQDTDIYFRFETKIIQKTIGFSLRELRFSTDPEELIKEKLLETESQFELVNNQ